MRADGQLYFAVCRRKSPLLLIALVSLSWVVTMSANVVECAGVATSAYIVRVAIGQRRTMPAGVLNGSFCALAFLILGVAMPLHAIGLSQCALIRRAC